MNVYLEVYGCTANKSDASLIMGVLKQNDFEVVEDFNDADVFIILTCTVIGTTEQRMLSRLRFFKKLGRKIIVAGCMASIQPDLIKSIIPDAQLLPAQYSHHILDLLQGKKVIFEPSKKPCYPKYYSDIIAPISIAEGCNFSCSYCITSLARGKLTSFPINDIIKDVRFALKQGCKEIQLTAQDTGSYGLDTGQRLDTLLTNICKIKGKYKIRIGMMNPYTALKILESLILAYNDPKIFKFLHLPVQSGDNKILKKMNRKYIVDDFYKIINEFRNNFPEITISTDVIVGFPTETEEQFQNTIKLLKKVNPDIVNITRFSSRPYTKAKDLTERIGTNIMKERSKKLTELSSVISKQNNKKLIGKKYTILVIKKGKKNTFIGRSGNYKPVILREKVDLGEFLNIEITDAASTYLVGKLI